METPRKPKLNICKGCSLYKNGFPNYVPGVGPKTELMIIGEAPGKDEVRYGTPFIGMAGREQDNYLGRVGLPRNRWYITNLVKCQPPGNRDPNPSEIECCANYLQEELEDYAPKIIVAVGRFAVKYFLGDVDMEAVHGIPFSIGDKTIVPCYHPAMGLRNTTSMTQIFEDYIAVAAMIKHVTLPRLLDKDSGTHFTYELLTDPWRVANILENRPIISIDTESEGLGGIPWCLTFCVSYGHGYMIKASDRKSLEAFSDSLQASDIKVVLHNALHDLNVLAQMGIHLDNDIEDTMVMAYLLQNEPQGLKSLAYRYLDVHMVEYSKIIKEAQATKSLEYLLKVIDREWPDPEPRLTWEKGLPKPKQPQNIKGKAKRILNDFAKDQGLDLLSRWEKIEDKLEVEKILDPMPRACLKDISFDRALEYAGKDAITTLGIYPILLSKIQKRNLNEVYHRDIKIIPMVNDMQKYGIKINPNHFRNLSNYFSDLMTDTQAKIENLYTLETGRVKAINPASPNQVAQALYDMGIFKFHNQSTSAEALDRVRGKHQVVNKITKWRGLKKLKGTYSEPIVKKTDENLRVHSTFRTTRVVTGRLSSSNPNLTNQPKRGPEAVKIRQGFIAEDGCVLLANDYSQIEMRLAAHCSQDSTMLGVFKEGKDMHSETASWIFGIPLELIDKIKHRLPAKSIGFGILYDISGIGLQKQLLAQGIQYATDQCQEMIDSWLRMYSGIRDYMDEVRSQARRFGYVQDIFGRRRLVPEVISIHRRIQEAGLRQAVNAPIQMGAQGIIKQAMCDLTPIYKSFQSDGWICRPLIQIHDDLIFEISEGVVDEVAPLIKVVMENAVQLCLPTPVEQKMGKNWGEMEGIQ